MPNRILKESVCYNGKIAGLSYFEEVLFYRIIVNCDDFGRLDARPEFLRGKCFVVKPRVTVRAVAEALDKLEQVGLIRRYTAENADYLLLPGWNAHQSIKVKKARFPAPSDGQPFGQPSDAQNTIQSESEFESQSESKRNRKEISLFFTEENFNAFWDAYPVKVRKDRAKDAYQKTVDVPVDTLLKAIAEHKTSLQWKSEGGKYIPYPANWLKSRGWEDHLPQSIPQGASGILGQAELEAIERVRKRREHDQE